MAAAERDASTRTRASQRRAHLSRTLRLDDSLRNNVPVRLPSGLTSLSSALSPGAKYLKSDAVAAVRSNRVPSNATPLLLFGAGSVQHAGTSSRLVLREPLRVTVIGLILGISGVDAIKRAVAALLVKVKPFDLATIAARGIGLMAIADVRFLLMC
jgi:hypothetical protein